MIILGIDPGTRRVGYGIVKGQGSEVSFVTAGILTVTAKDDAAALFEVKQELSALIRKYKPDALIVEKLFFAKNQKTALAVAQARGVILLSGQELGIPIKEYTPNEIKLGITGYGTADKKAVFKMVKLILGENNLKIIDDASDALAMAIVGLNGIRIAGEN